MSPPFELSVAEAGRLIAGGSLSSVDLVDSVLARAEETEPIVGAYTTLVADAARAAAMKADAELSSGNHRGPLHGIPIAVKDLYLTKGIATQAGSKVMEGYVPDKDAVAVERMRSSGAIILGKTVTTEFGYGQAPQSSKNPWNLGCYPGGSSVGSAVSVAVGSAMAALGSDAGGSIRSPAAWNSVVGFKPTFDVISTTGTVRCGQTLDTCGPITRSVEDTAILMSVLAERFGPSGVDPIRLPFDRNPSLDGITLGVERSYFFSEAVVPGVRKVAEEAIDLLKDLGATIVDCKIPSLDNVMPASMVILAVEMSFLHQKWLREQGDSYAPGTRLMLELGELVLATDYLRALQVRRDLKMDVKRVFEKHDLTALVSSTSPMTAIPFAAFDVALGKGRRALSDRIKHVVPFNLTGQPAISIPCGFADNGMPVGLQIVGRPYADQDVLAVAAAYQQAVLWHHRRPPL